MARPTPSVERVLALIGLLGEHPGEFFTLSEIARRLDLNKATAHGILAVLSDGGQILRHPDDKGYTLGPAMTTLGRAALAREYEIIRVARMEMDDLADTSRGQCVATALFAERTFTLYVTGTPSGPGATTRGSNAPFLPPYSMVFAAWSAPAAQERWLTGEDLQADEVERLRGSLKLIRERGFSVTTLSEHRVEMEELLFSLLKRVGNPALRSAMGEVARQMQREGGEIEDLRPDRSYVIRQISAPVFDVDGVVRIVIALAAQPSLTGSEVRDLGYAVAAAASRITKQLAMAQPKLATAG